VNDDPLADIRGMRIAHLSESDGPGGMERVLAQLAAALQAGGCENVAFLPADGDGWLESQLANTGVAVERFRIDGWVSRGFAQWLESAFRRHRITLAHSHEFTMAFYGAWGARRAGISHVITMHGSRYYAARLRRRLAMRAAVAASGLTVTVSEALADQLSQDLRVRPSRIVTIPNGVGFVPATRGTLREELALGPHDRLLVAVGNLYPVKGHKYLVEALGLLTARHPSVHVAIAGRGETADALAAQAGLQALGGRLHLLGLRSDIPSLLASADVFVLPSLSEGLPLSLLEAMLAGCPIVASDVGAISSVLAGGDAGVLVEPGAAPALAAALDRVLRDPAAAREMGMRAARRAAREYQLSAMVARYAAAYRKVAGVTGTRASRS
jgi:glycosyltransferase involved in cell wall biosynthesis